MNTVIRSAVFDAWLRSLRDFRGKARIVARIEAAQWGNFGDCRFIGSGVSEMRVHHGPGYRIYFTRRGRAVYLLLSGGDKSTQERDIGVAIEMAQELEE